MRTTCLSFALAFSIAALAPMPSSAQQSPPVRINDSMAPLSAQLPDAARLAQFDAYVARVQKQFNVPGVAVAANQFAADGCFHTAELVVDRLDRNRELVLSPADGRLGPPIEPYPNDPAKRGRLTGVRILTDDGYQVRVLYVDGRAAGLGGAEEPLHERRAVLVAWTSVHGLVLLWLDGEGPVRSMAGSTSCLVVIPSFLQILP